MAGTFPVNRAAVAWPRSGHQIVSELRGYACLVISAARWGDSSDCLGVVSGANNRGAPRGARAQWQTDLASDVRLQHARRSFPKRVAVASHPILKAIRELPNTHTATPRPRRGQRVAKPRQRSCRRRAHWLFRQHARWDEAGRRAQWALSVTHWRCSARQRIRFCCERSLRTKPAATREHPGRTNATATLNVRSSGASRRAPLIPVGPPPVQPPARSGAKAAFSS